MSTYLSSLCRCFSHHAVFLGDFAVTPPCASLRESKATRAGHHVFCVEMALLERDNAMLTGHHVFRIDVSHLLFFGCSLTSVFALFPSASREYWCPPRFGWLALDSCALLCVVYPALRPACLGGRWSFPFQLWQDRGHWSADIGFFVVFPGGGRAGDMMVGCGDGEIHRFNLDQGRFRTPITLPSGSSSQG